MNLRMLGAWPSWLVLVVAVGFGILAWWLYFRETRYAVNGVLRWLLPSLRGVAVFLIVLMLGEPTLESEVREGELSEIVIAIDASESMRLRDLRTAEKSNGGKQVGTQRYARALATLLGQEEFDPNLKLENQETPSGLLGQLKDRFDIRVVRFEGDDSILMWDSSQPIPNSVASWLPKNWSNNTQLGSALESTNSGLGGEAENFVVLMSDGQNNAGAALSDIARKIQPNTTTFAVGFGNSTNSADIILRDSRIPSSFYHDDSVSGTVLIREVGSELPYKLRLLYAEQEVWSRSLTSEDNSNREIRFEFPAVQIMQLAEDLAGQNVSISNLPVRIQAIVETSGTAREPIENNTLDLFTCIRNQKAKVLLIDGRSRWETRYLKNLFERDPAWELRTVVLQPGEEVKDSVGRTFSDGGPNFPTERSELLDFNLVILGDVAPDKFEQQFLEWLQDFVENGGGLIFVDGARENLRQFETTAIQDLFPIKWLGSQQTLASTIEPTDAGSRLEALRLSDTSSSELNSDSEVRGSTWQDLPPLRFISLVKPKVGAEVLLNARDALSATPLLISSRFGAGRILFLASDETWRWRYRIADLQHAHVWNQLARWTMRNPLSKEGEFLSLDTGKPNYAPEESIEIQCQLRDLEGKPKSNMAAMAIVSLGDSVVRRIKLVESTERLGSYASVLNGLPSGEYSVRIEAAGFPKDALGLESKFSVMGNPSLEYLETACNDGVLKNLAQNTGGEYFSESNAQELVEYLRPLSNGRIQRQSTILWQSYWWFSVIVIILVFDWALRKRAGLI